MEKNNQLLTEEKIKKKFKSLNELIILVLGIVIIPGIIMMCFLDPLINNKHNTSYDYIQSEEYHYDDFIETFQEKHPKTYSILHYGVTICLWGCMLSVFFVIGKISKEIQNTGKPFSANTLKNMNILTTIIIIWAIISLFNIFSNVEITIGLVPASIICVLKYIFEYGYKLQIESDETL
ncbi:MAG: hypothetical protein J5507_07040 [Clostridia bacterium]|nr:hypothetical protein [Clostridia bacterium]